MFITPTGTAITATPASKTAEKSGADLFLEYMKKSPAQRMQEAWLAARGMTKEQFDALPPEEKEKLLAQMRADIEDKLRRETEAKINRATV